MCVKVENFTIKQRIINSILFFGNSLNIFNQNFHFKIQKFRDFLETLRETAVKEQEVAISQAITKQYLS